MARVNQFKVGLAQLNSELGDNAANLERALEYVDRAAQEEADLVMFPELYLQGYHADELFATTAEPIPGPTTERLQRAARERGLYIVMGMARLEETYPFCMYNSLCFVGPEGLLGYYDKIHIPTFHFRADPAMEGAYFAPGRRIPVFDTRLGRVSVQICYDLIYPELTRAQVLKGSLVNLVLLAGPCGGDSEQRARILLQARSIENAVSSVCCNVVGNQKDFCFYGASKVVSPAGEVVAEGKLGEEDFVVGTIDLEETLRRRRQWLLFRDRKPELYGDLTAPLSLLASPDGAEMATRPDGADGLVQPALSRSVGRGAGYLDQERSAMTVRADIA